MVFERFGMVCLVSMLFGVMFAVIVQESRAGRPEFGRERPCAASFHPACANSSL